MRGVVDTRTINQGVPFEISDDGPLTWSPMKISRFTFRAVLILGLLSVATWLRAQTVSGSVVPAEQQRIRTAKVTDTVSVALREGSNFLGRITAVRGDSAHMTTSVGEVHFAIADVRRSSVVHTKDVVNGEYWFPNPNTTRLMFAPTARMLKKGEGYFSDYLVFFPGVAYGVTDRITVGGGMSIVPGISLNKQIFYITPKIGVVHTGKFTLALGALVARAGLGNDDNNVADSGYNRTFGIPYVVSTYGDDNGSVTGGVGYGYADGKLTKRPALMFGGDRRLSRRFGIISENYVFPSSGDGALMSFGARFLGEKLSVDFGAVRILGVSDGVWFPFIGLIVNF